MTKTIKTIEFNKLLPDFKRFTAGIRQINRNNHNKSIQYLSNVKNYLVCTDAYKLIRINSKYIQNNPFTKEQELYSFKDKEVFLDDELKFPKVERLIPTNFRTEARINKNTFTELRKSLNKIDKKVKEKNIENNQIGLKIENGFIGLFNNVTNKIYSFECMQVGEDVTLYANSSFLKDTLMAVNKLSSFIDGDITIKFDGAMRPIYIGEKDAFDIILLPLRVYN